MNEPAPNPPAVEFKDRKAGLVVFGVLTLLLGCLCGLFVPLMILAQTMAAKTTGVTPDYQTVLPAILTYGILAVALVWLGIGSMQARRWARALLLMFSWSWLILGVMALGVWAVMAPQFLKAVSAAMPAGQPEMPGAAKVVMVLIPLLMLTVMFVVLPGIWVVFYKSPHVKATCEAHDPVMRWTDRCPLPVLVISCWLGLGVPMMLTMPLLYHGVFPFFGDFLIGFPGIAAQMGLAVVWGYCARAFYKLDVRGWWVLVASLCLFTVSHVLTYSRHDLIELYQLMGYPEQQIEQIRKFNFMTGTTMAWGGALGMLPFFGYLIYVKRFFPRIPSP